MIRYHNAGFPNGLIVSTRRRPRGWIIKAKETKRVTTEGSSYGAYGPISWIEVNYETRDGWRPVGFNGYQGPVFYTKRAAADYLISHHKFREEDQEKVIRDGKVGAK